MELKLDTNKEYGLVLEGGGAKGAYQIGAWKALKEAGIHVKGIAGTSVGALNGALIAMDDFEKAERIWETIRYSRVMDVDDELVEQLKTSSLKDIAALGLSELIPAAKKVLKDRGFDIAPLRSLIEEVVDEEKIRNSEKELYVVTYSLSDRKPMVVNVKEVPDGEIADMLMASAYLIGFRREKLGGKYYMDGGGVNNVPIDVLIEKGYKDILVFRIYGYGVDTERRLKVPDDVHLYHVAPRQDLGGLLEFDRRRARKNMVLGYFDAKRMLYGLEGSVEKSRHDRRRQGHRRQADAICARRHMELHRSGREIRGQRPAEPARRHGTSGQHQTAARQGLPDGRHQTRRRYGHIRQRRQIHHPDGQIRTFGNLRIRRFDARRHAQLRQGQTRSGFGSGARLHRRL